MNTLPNRPAPAAKSRLLRAGLGLLAAGLLATPLSAETLIAETFDQDLTGRWFWTGGRYLRTNFNAATNDFSTSNQFFTTSFTPTALGDGDSLTVSFNYNPASLNVRTVDVGFFSGTAATQTGWNQYDAASISHTWRGYFGRLSTAGENNQLIRRIGANNDHPFFGGALLANGAALSTLTTGTTRAARLSLVNNGGDITITLSEGADFANLTSLVSTLVEDGQTEFGILSFYLRTNSGSGNGGLLFDNITVEHVANVPEPSAFAALAGLGALGLAASRRRRRAT